MEDKKRIANEELSGLFDSEKISNEFIQNSLQASSRYSEIPTVENTDVNETTVVNNNVSIALESNSPARTIEKEINNFLKTQRISDPLDLKKNYTINLNQEILNNIENEIFDSEVVDMKSNFIPESISQRMSADPDFQEIQNIINETKNTFYNSSNINLINDKVYRELSSIQAPKIFNASYGDSVESLNDKMEMMKDLQQQLESEMPNQLNSMNPQQSMNMDPNEMMEEMISDYTESMENSDTSSVAYTAGRASSVPVERKNINSGSMKTSSIDLLLNKMNSPPIWRTVLG